MVMDLNATLFQVRSVRSDYSHIVHGHGEKIMNRINNINIGTLEQSYIVLPFGDIF